MKKIKKLYHVTLDNHGKSKKFQPRIPTNRYEGGYTYHPYIGEELPEDDQIPRICVSPSLTGAISAITLPDTGADGIKAFVYQAVDPLGVTADLPRILVPDAKETKEHWILTPTKMKRIGSIRIRDRVATGITYEWIKKDEK